MNISELLDADMLYNKDYPLFTMDDKFHLKQIYKNSEKDNS